MKILKSYSVYLVTIVSFISCSNSADPENTNQTDPNIPAISYSVVNTQNEITLHTLSGNDILPDIEQAVDSLENLSGGIIRLPSGTFPLSSRVAIPGGIGIVGKSKDSTILQLQTNSGFVYNESGFKSGSVWISGISFDVPRTAILLRNISDFRINDCHFNSTNNNGYLVNIGTRITGYTSPRGVIDHCSFNGRKTSYCVHVGPQQWPEDESRIHYIGSGQTIFVEDCIFNEPYHAVASFNGSHYVLRYSQIIHPGSGVDAHGPGYEYILDNNNEQYRGGRCAEIYNNSFVSDPADDVWGAVKLRSGGGLIFNNSFWGGDYAIIFELEINSYNATNGAYPALDQIQEMYIWNNTTTNLNRDFIYLYLHNADDFIQENRDYFMYAPEGYIPYQYPHPLIGMYEGK